MEHIQDKVKYRDRVFEVIESEDTMLFFAQQLEMAYLAGLNHIDLSGPMVLPQNLRDTGEYLTAARNYVKDKGYKI